MKRTEAEVRLIQDAHDTAQIAYWAAIPLPKPYRGAVDAIETVLTKLRLVPDTVPVNAATSIATGLLTILQHELFVAEEKLEIATTRYDEADKALYGHE